MRMKKFIGIILLFFSVFILVSCNTSVMVYKSFLIDHHFCIFRGIFASF